MALTPQQVIELKAQLKEQVQNLPADQKKQTEEYIDSMSPEAIELMLQQQQSSDGEKTIFRRIVEKEIDSVIVDENSDSIAVLDINPISQGHTLVIPKHAAPDPKAISQGAFSLAKNISEKISHRLKAKSVRLETEKKFGEAVIHLIPIYDKDLTLSSPRQKASTEELKKISSEINVIEQKKPKLEVQVAPELPKDPIRLKRRIP